jgi:iron complex outermembrane receptor protein
LTWKADTNFKFGKWGRLNSDLAVDYYLSYKEDGGRDEIGDPGQPEFRATLSNTYKISAFTVAYNINYTDSTAINVIDGKQAGHVPSWTTHDIQVAYDTPWGGTLALGATNLFNRLPENIPYDGRPYNFYLYDAYGRTPYFSYTQRF